MWNDASEKKKIVCGSMMQTRKKNLIKGISAAETINTREAILTISNLKNRK